MKKQHIKCEVIVILFIFILSFFGCKPKETSWYYNDILRKNWAISIEEPVCEVQTVSTEQNFHGDGIRYRIIKADTLPPRVNSSDGLILEWQRIQNILNYSAIISRINELYSKLSGLDSIISDFDQALLIYKQDEYHELYLIYDSKTNLLHLLEYFL